MITTEMDHLFPPTWHSISERKVSSILITKCKLIHCRCINLRRRADLGTFQKCFDVLEINIAKGISSTCFMKGRWGNRRLRKDCGSLII